MKRLLIATVLGSLTACNIQNVDIAQPVAVADKFYGALKSGDSQTALTQFAPEFRSHVNEWPNLLSGLDEHAGRVTTAELQGGSLAANKEGPCYLLTYLVKRGQNASNELLFICSKRGASEWFIHGHRLTRTDTKQSISGGILPTEVGTQTP